MGHLEKLSSWFEAFEHDRRRFLDPRTRERDRRDVERALLAAHGGLTSVAVRLGLQSLVPSHRRAAAAARAREGDRVFAKGIHSTLGDAALLAGRFVDAAAQYRKAAELTSPADDPPPKPRSARQPAVAHPVRIGSFSMCSGIEHCFKQNTDLGRNPIVAGQEPERHV